MVSAFCGAFPILPGKVDALCRLAEELNDARAGEWAASRLRVGVTCGEWFLQRLHELDLLIVWFEAENPEAVFVALANSGEAFDVWLRQAATEVIGVDLSELAKRPFPQKLLDYSV